MVQKTHKHWSTRNVFLDLFFPFKYKYRITARYSTFDEKLIFASLAMFDIEHLMREWHDKGAIVPSGLKHVLKQGMKILGVSVNWKWDRLVTHWLVLVSIFILTYISLYLSSYCCTRFINDSIHFFYYIKIGFIICVLYTCPSPWNVRQLTSR